MLPERSIVGSKTCRTNWFSLG